MDKIEKIKDYLMLLEQFELSESSYANILHPDFSQIEFPNGLNKVGQTSDYSEIFKRMKIGRSILTNQRYQIDSAIEQQNKAYVEANWSGTMAVDAGPLKKGQQLTAHFCMAFEFVDGKIYRQRNYDCFDPF
ncbi:MAG: nuclear transport factor 2 family protein [Bdellovibrionales bacterium]|nr:nuclear transport factor 2 family protein [Bdellovibrionales bacterium]